MKLSYEHWHGCHNHFFVIFASASELQMPLSQLRSLLIEQASELCAGAKGPSRADGILLIAMPDEKDQLRTCPTSSCYELTIINADGSLARNCGNGLRVACLALKRAAGECIYIRVDPEITTSSDLRAPSSLIYATRASQLQGWAEVDTFLPPESEQPWPEDLHHAVLQAAEHHFNSTDGFSQPYDLSLQHLGNHHLIVRWDADTPPSQATAVLKAWAEEVAGIFKAAGKATANTHFCYPTQLNHEHHHKAQQLSLEGLSSHALTLIPWERGVGLTQGCSSGAAAASLAFLQSIQSSLRGEEELLWRAVHMPGGRVWTRLQHAPNPQHPHAKIIQVLGSAECIGEGSWKL